MNIAVTTFVLAVLLLPGIIFRRFYYTEEFSKQYNRNSFFELFFSTLIPSILLHSLWYFVVQLFDYRIDFIIIGDFFTNNKILEAFQNINDYLTQIIIYHISLFIFAGLTGFFGKKLIRFFILDRRVKIFRFKNSWHYLFSGEFFDFPRASFDILDDVDEIEYFYVDIITDSKEGTIIYEGFLVDYELAPNGGLDYIVIKDVERRFLKDDNNLQHNYDIPGHVLIIPFRSIININLTFYKLKINVKNNGEYEVEPILVE